MHYIFIPLYHQHLASSIILRKAHLTMYSNANKSTQRKIQSYIIMVKSRIRKSSLDVMLEFYLFLLRVTFFCFFFISSLRIFERGLGRVGQVNSRPMCASARRTCTAPGISTASLVPAPGAQSIHTGCFQWQCLALRGQAPSELSLFYFFFSNSFFFLQSL